MDYKEKYEQAIENFKKIKAANKENKELVDFIEYKYPELKDGCDERIRKEILDFVRSFWADHKEKLPQIGRWVTYLEKQGEQKPINDIEPRFKVGDYIINGHGFIMQIDGIDGNMYVYHILDDNRILKHDITQTEESCHLWTIQDAKNGDVLAVGNMIFVYKTVLASHIVSYCKLFNNEFECFNDIRTCCEENSKVHPATEEQRDTLMKAMADAGYTFNFKKKELEKIEKQSAEPQNEKELSNFESALFSAFSDGWQQYLHGEEVDMAQWAREHSAELLEVAREQKSTWSEEDEKMYNSLRSMVHGTYVVQTQETLDKLLSWLKSIKLQHHWKPSDEQMVYLKKVYESYYFCDGERCALESLYNDLKKL